MRIIGYHRPSSKEEASRLLEELGARGAPMAGATGFHFLQDASEKVAVDLTDSGLAGICRDGDRFVIGATTALEALASCEEEGWALHRVARRISTQPIRNISTLGGNVARVFPWADLPVALLALGAELTIEGTNPAAMDSDAFFASQPARLFKPGDLLTRATVPIRKAGWGFGYRKVNLVQASFSLASASAWLRVENGSVVSARVAAGGALPMPKRLPAVEEAIVGHPTGALREAVTGACSALSWKGREGCSDDYAARLASVTVADAVEDAAREAEDTGS